MSSSISHARSPQQSPSELSEHVYARTKDYVLYQGDSLALMVQFAGQTVDLIWGDAPYFL